MSELPPNDPRERDPLMVPYEEERPNEGHGVPTLLGRLDPRVTSPRLAADVEAETVASAPVEPDPPWALETPPPPERPELSLPRPPLEAEGDAVSAFERNLALFRAQGYRTVALLGSRQSGKTAFVVRLIQHLQGHTKFQPNPDYRGEDGKDHSLPSHFEARLKDLRDSEGRMMATGVLEFGCYPVWSKEQRVVFFDVAGEHFLHGHGGPEQNELRERVLSLLRTCDAFIAISPIDPKPAAAAAPGEYYAGYEADRFLGSLGPLIQQLSRNGRLRQPFAVVFTKADLYEGTLGIDPEQADALEVARAHCPAFALLVHHLRHVRFFFTSTGTWVRKEAGGNDEFWALNFESPSRGLMGPFRFVIGRPSRLTLTTRALVALWRLLRWIGGGGATSLLPLLALVFALLSPSTAFGGPAGEPSTKQAQDVFDASEQAYLTLRLPSVGRLVYGPPRLNRKESKGWPAHYDRAMSALYDQRSLWRARGALEKAEMAAGSDPERLVTSFALGTVLVLDGRPAKALTPLRWAIGDLSHRSRKDGVDSWVSDTVTEVGLPSHAPYVNLVVAYLGVGPRLTLLNNDPWKRALRTRCGEKGQYGELDRCEPAGASNPHAALLRRHRGQSPGASDALHLIWANSNLEQLFRDQNNVDRSRLLPLCALEVLRLLGQPPGPVLARLADGAARSSAARGELPVIQLGQRFRVLGADEARTLLLQQLARELLLAGQPEQAVRLAAPLPDLQARIRGLQARIADHRRMKGFLAAAAPPRSEALVWAGSAEEEGAAQRVVRDPGLAPFHATARAVLARATQLLAPEPPAHWTLHLAWALPACVLLLLGIRFVWVNLRALHRLRHPGYAPDRGDG